MEEEGRELGEGGGEGGGGGESGETGQEHKDPEGEMKWKVKMVKKIRKGIQHACITIIITVPV